MTRRVVRVLIPVGHVRIWGTQASEFMIELPEEVTGRFKVSFFYYVEDAQLSFKGADDVLLVITQHLFRCKIDMGRHNMGINVRVLMPQGNLHEALEMNLTALDAVVVRFPHHNADDREEKMLDEIFRAVEGFFVAHAV